MSDAPNNDLELIEEAIVNPEPPAAVEKPVERELPDKYKGKSVFDLIEMHTNAERKISDQGRELGDLRRTADELLGLKKENAKIEKVKVTTEDLLSDPDQALNKVISQSDVAEKADATANRLEAIERSIGQREFEGRFPEFVKDVSDPTFQSWVSSNRARAKLLVDLNNYDFEAGNSLWEMWEEHKSSNPRQEAPDKKAAITAAKTVRNSPAEGARKPTYSRAKLLELQTKAMRGDRAAQARWNDPVFQAEYQAAYAEGRVK